MANRCKQDLFSKTKTIHQSSNVTHDKWIVAKKKQKLHIQFNHLVDVWHSLISTQSNLSEVSISHAVQTTKSPCYKLEKKQVVTRSRPRPENNIMLMVRSHRRQDKTRLSLSCLVGGYEWKKELVWARVSVLQHDRSALLTVVLTVCASSVSQLDGTAM